MKALPISTVLIAGTVFLFSGCATKKYVRNTTAPIQAKVDQVGEQANNNSQSIEQTRTQLKDLDDRAQSGISAAQERAASADQHALTADQHASDAMNRANDAASAADRNRQGLDQLRGVISEIDDYKLQASLSVPFHTAQYSLSSAAKADLDKLSSEVKSDKRSSSLSRATPIKSGQQAITRISVAAAPTASSNIWWQKTRSRFIGFTWLGSASETQWLPAGLARRTPRTVA